MDINELEALIHGDVTKRFQEYNSSGPPDPPDPPSTSKIVKTTNELLAALEQGGSIEMQGQEFYNPGGFVVRSKTNLFSTTNALVRADNQPAIRIKPKTTDVVLDAFAATCNFSGAVHQWGDNDVNTQSTPEDVPLRITGRKLSVPTHRGKRGIEVNAGDVLIQGCQIEDVYATSAADSQAICILNSPGHIVIEDSKLSAGSENIMLGGDSMKVAGQVIRDVIIRNCHLFKPMSWKDDGINRAVKNLIELKAGDQIQILNCTLDGSWRAAQDGWAFVITPRNSQSVTNVTLDGCNAINVSGGVNIMGLDYNLLPPEATNNVVIKNCTFDVSKLLGGRGILALITNNTKALTFDNVTFNGDGSAIITSDSKEPQGPCLVKGSALKYLNYGVTMPGSNYGNKLDPASPYYPRRLEVDFLQNTFTGTVNSQFKKNFPNNIWPA